MSFEALLDWAKIYTSGKEQHVATAENDEAEVKSASNFLG